MVYNYTYINSNIAIYSAISLANRKWPRRRRRHLVFFTFFRCWWPTIYKESCTVHSRWPNKSKLNSAARYVYSAIICNNNIIIEIIIIYTCVCIYKTARCFSFLLLYCCVLFTFFMVRRHHSGFHCVFRYIRRSATRLYTSWPDDDTHVLMDIHFFLFFSFFFNITQLCENDMITTFQINLEQLRKKCIFAYSFINKIFENILFISVIFVSFECIGSKYKCASGYFLN